MTEQQTREEMCNGGIAYKEFIHNILDTRGRFVCGNEYHERHHIVPRCLGGNDDEENLIDLYAREHFIAHMMLAKENPDNRQLTLAWHLMTNVKTKHQQRYCVTPDEYEEARLAYIQTITGDNNPSKSDEVRRKKSVAIKGEKNHNYGKPRSETTRKKISKAHQGKIFSAETRKRISESKSGENNPNYGKSFSDERRKKISESAKACRTKEWKEAHSGKNSPSAKKIIRLSDGTVYEYMGQAGQENGMSAQAIRRRCKQQKGFMYYDEYLTQQNNRKELINEQESGI